MQLTVSLAGADEAAQALRAALASLPPAAAEGLAQGAQAMADEARRLCPVDTGGLRESIAARAQPSSNGAQAQVTADAPHAAYVELGTRRMAARPFLLPAYQAGREALTQAVARAVREAVGA